MGQVYTAAHHMINLLSQRRTVNFCVWLWETGQGGQIFRTIWNVVLTTEPDDDIGMQSPIQLHKQPSQFGPVVMVGVSCLSYIVFLIVYDHLLVS